jgi:hypothetical protein
MNISEISRVPEIALKPLIRAYEYFTYLRAITKTHMTMAKKETNEDYNFSPSECAKIITNLMAKPNMKTVFQTFTNGFDSQELIIKMLKNNTTFTSMEYDNIISACQSQRRQVAEKEIKDLEEKKKNIDRTIESLKTLLIPK